MCDFGYGIVTCEYCANFIRNEYSKESNIFELAWGMCKKHSVKKQYDDKICKDFVIISGYHTPKWYPNKKTE